MSTTLPGAVLRRALVLAGPPTPPAVWSERDLQLVAEAIEEAGYLVVARADVHALRAAADRVLRFVPPTRWPHAFNGDVGQPCREPGCGQMASNGAAH